jgi:predicted RND superfamily exporter protein
LAFGLSIIAVKSGMGFFASFGIAVALVIVAIVAASAVDIAPSPEEQRAYDEATKVERAAVKAWEKTFACNSCGHRFVPLV